MVIPPLVAKTRAPKENGDGRIVCGIVWGSADRKGTSENAGEVSLSRKGAKSRSGTGGLRSKTTKAGTDVEHLRAANVELKKKLAEALQQQTATSEVLSVT
jgi:hypothetical protein